MLNVVKGQLAEIAEVYFTYFTYSLHTEHYAGFFSVKPRRGEILFSGETSFFVS